MHGQASSTTDKKRKKTIKSKNFVEALTELGNEVANTAARDVAGGVAEDVLNQITGRKKAGEIKPNQEINLQELDQTYQEKKEKHQQFYQEYLDIRHQEKLLYKRTERETEYQIVAILEELKKLSLSTKKLAKEVQVAAEQVPVAPGSYHLTFFEKLRQTIVFLKKKVDESATWLSAFNQKAKKRGYYWNQVQKSGAKFMLSHERAVATQAG